MGTNDTYGLGYERVDDDPNVSVLLATMDATAGWEATRRLRTWERDQLKLGGAQRLLDIGCGLGEAALTLAQDLGEDGEVVGIDVSAEMLHVARAKAGEARCRVRFTVGDACALDEPGSCFHVVRSERTLQWLADPVAAVAEMARVVRPGGRISLIDTDWSTFAIDVGDDDLAARVREAMRTERGRPSNIGRRLHDLIRDAGFAPFAEAEATHTWNSWNPDESPAPDGCFSMQSLADDLVAAHQLAPADRDRFVSTIRQAALRDRFSMTLTMYAVVGAAPTT
ncbi:MAG: methyltransferase domain-containing protein [Ilumatobacteraceae bacterium]